MKLLRLLAVTMRTHISTRAYSFAAVTAWHKGIRRQWWERFQKPSENKTDQHTYNSGEYGFIRHLEPAIVFRTETLSSFQVPA